MAVTHCPLRPDRPGPCSLPRALREDREDFRTALRDFTRLYAFLADVVPVGSPDTERMHLYGRVLLPRLPSSPDAEIVDRSGAAVLTHLRIEKSEFTDPC